MFDWVQHLLQLRAQMPELEAGEEQVLEADANTLVYVRGTQLGRGCAGAAPTRVLVAVNKSGAPKQLSFGTRETALAGCTAGESKLGDLKQKTAPDGVLTMTVAPGASVVLFR